MEKRPRRLKKRHIYAICVAALFLLFGVIFVVTRVIDNNWTSWQLPTVLGIMWVVLAIKAGLILGLFALKSDMKKTEGKKI